MADADLGDEILNAIIADAAAREKELTEGRCELPTPHEGTTVAVTMIDMLVVEAEVTATVLNRWRGSSARRTRLTSSSRGTPHYIRTRS